MNSVQTIQVSTPGGEENNDHKQQDSSPQQNVSISESKQDDQQQQQHPSNTTSTSTPDEDYLDNMAINLKKTKHYDDLITIDPDTSYFYAKNRPVWLNIILVVVITGLGFVQGLAYHRIGLTSPRGIVGQFTFKIWLVMRFFFSSMGAALFFQGVLDFVAPSLFDGTREVRRSKVGFIRSAIGAALIAIGMVFSGVGASIIFAQLGAASGNSEFVIVGLLAGALVSSIIAKVFDIPWFEMAEDVCPIELPNSKQKNNQDKYVNNNNLVEMQEQKGGEVEKKENEEQTQSSNKWTSVDDFFGIRYWKLAIPLGLGIFGFACILDFAIPGTGRKADSERLGLMLLWPGVAAGVITGLNNVLFALICNSNSSGGRLFFSVWSLLSWGKLAPRDFPNKFKHLIGAAQFWVGMALGAFASVTIAVNADKDSVFLGSEVLARIAYEDQRGLDKIWRSVVGGFLMSVGVFVAFDCNCAKAIGISFSFENIVFTAVLFGTAIITGWIFYGAEKEK